MRRPERRRQCWRGDALAALLWLTLLVLVPTPALAENAELVRARQLYGEMQYEQADQAFRAALKQSDNRPRDLVDIYLHLGIIAASTNRRTEAVDNFVRMLCIDPAPTIGEELPPKVQRRLDEARTRADQVTRFAIAAEPASPRPRAGGLQVVATVTADSLGLASGIVLRYRLAGQPAYQSAQQPLARRVTFDLTPAQAPPDREVEYLLQLTDPNGSTLYELGSEVAPLRQAAPVPPALVQGAAGSAGHNRASGADSEPGGSWLTEPWFLIAAGAGAVALLAGGATAAAVAWVVTEPKQAHFGQVSQEIGRAR